MHVAGPDRTFLVINVCGQLTLLNKFSVFIQRVVDVSEMNHGASSPVGIIAFSENLNFRLVSDAQQ